MKKLIPFLTLPFFLSGCFYQTVNQNDIAAAIEICAKRQTYVVEVSSHAFGVETVTCSDRTIWTITNESLMKNKNERHL